MTKETGTKLIAQNKKARHDYAISDTYEAGIVLTGTEVKSLRAGRASLIASYAGVKDGEVWLHGVHIPEYTEGTWNNHTPRRVRKLLLHRDEIAKMLGKLRDDGVTLVPLSLYFKGGRAKLELGIGRGRKHYDKRQVIAERDSKRDADRAMAARRRHE